VFENRLIAIHLGINPDRGGRPLRESNNIGIINFMIGEWVIIFLSLFVLVRFFICIIKNIGEMIIE
jgi:hypothetical protein